MSEARKSVLACAVVALLPGCCIADGLPDTTIEARHFPLYNAEPHDSVIEATATNPKGLLEEITIHAVKGKVSDCTDLGQEPSVIPCRTRAAAEEPAVCKIEARGDSAVCELNIAITDGDMVTYTAVATLETGEKVRTIPVTYSGGQPGAVVAMPVWWHSDAPARSLDADRLDVAFYPAPGLVGDATTFSSQLSSIVRQSIIAPEKRFARLYAKNRARFNLWAFPHSGAQPDLVDCNHSFDLPALALDTLADGSAILHLQGERDCSFIGTGASGTVDVRAGHQKEAWLFVHESGHFMFGLADEYGDGEQVPLSDPPNTFATEDDCEASPLFVGSAVCRRIRWNVDRYRIVTTEPETMGGSRVFTSDFRNSSEKAVENQFDKCAGGGC